MTSIHRLNHVIHHLEHALHFPLLENANHALSMLQELVNEEHGSRGVHSLRPQSRLDRNPHRLEHVQRRQAIMDEKVDKLRRGHPQKKHVENKEGGAYDQPGRPGVPVGEPFRMDVGQLADKVNCVVEEEKCEPALGGSGHGQAGDQGRTQIAAHDLGEAPTQCVAEEGFPVDYDAGERSNQFDHCSEEDDSDTREYAHDGGKLIQTKKKNSNRMGEKQYLEADWRRCR